MYLYLVEDFLTYSIVWDPNVEPPGDSYKTGDSVRVVIDLDQSGPVPNPGPINPDSTAPPSVLYVTFWEPNIFGSDLFGNIGSNFGAVPLALRSVVWVVTSVCDVEVAGGMTAEEVSDLLFGPPPGAAARPLTGTRSSRFPATSVDRLLDSCSHGALSFKAAGSLVRNLSLPCSGYRGTGAAWSAQPGNSTCGPDELWGWMEYAASQTPELDDMDGYDDDLVPRHLRRLLVLPTASPAWPLCRGWNHRGTYGCDAAAGCSMWLKADRAQLLEWAATQIGASMVLRPAGAAAGLGGGGGAGGRQAADLSDPLGSPDAGYRCYNAPNAYKLGYSSALQTLDATNRIRIEGTQFPVLLPASTTTPASILLINPNWPLALSAPPPLLFGQFRSRLDGDSGLAVGVRERVLLHLSNATLGTNAAGGEAAPPTLLVAALQPGQQYRYAAARVVVSFTGLVPSADGGESDPGGVTGSVARVTVCGYRVATEAAAEGGCGNGMDDDCDGLVDAEDPDCTTSG